MALSITENANVFKERRKGHALDTVVIYQRLSGIAALPNHMAKCAAVSCTKN